MATNNFLQHNPTSANQETDAAYNADATRTGGLVLNQLVQSIWLNKILYQVTTFIAAFAAMMVAKGYSMMDTSLSALQAVLANLVTKADWTSGNNANGYWEKSPSGKITQWGSVVTNTTHSTSVTFPIAFSNATTIRIMLAVYATGNSKQMPELNPGDTLSNPITTNGFGVTTFDLSGDSTSNTVHWYAVGY